MKKTHVFLLVGATCIILLGGLWGAGMVQIGPKAEKEPSSDPMNQPSSDPTKQTDKQAEDKKPKELNVGKSEPKYFVNSIGMKFVWIPPGSFLMGSPLNEEGRGGGEIQHRVTLTKGFFMGVHTVTQKEWRTVMGNNPSNFKGEKHLPVERVSWNDCQELANKLREKDKKMYRLPSEAEWEYACRAGTKTPFHFGDTIAPDQANYNCNFIYGTGKKGSFREKTTPVGSFPANAWGLHDMHGNVWEWCQDWYGDYPTKDLVDPQGADNGKERVLRGGSWFHRPENCRSALRFKYEPGFRSFDFGFRLCFFGEEVYQDKPSISEKEKPLASKAVGVYHMLAPTGMVKLQFTEAKRFIYDGKNDGQWSVNGDQIVVKYGPHGSVALTFKDENTLVGVFYLKVGSEILSDRNWEMVREGTEAAAILAKRAMERDKAEQGRREALANAQKEREEAAKRITGGELAKLTFAEMWQRLGEPTEVARSTKKRNVGLAIWKSGDDRYVVVSFIEAIDGRSPTLVLTTHVNRSSADVERLRKALP